MNAVETSERLDVLFRDRFGVDALEEVVDRSTVLTRKEGRERHGYDEDWLMSYDDVLPDRESRLAYGVMEAFEHGYDEYDHVSLAELSEWFEDHRDAHLSTEGYITARTQLQAVDLFKDVDWRD